MNGGGTDGIRRTFRFRDANAEEFPMEKWAIGILVLGLIASLLALSSMGVGWAVLFLTVFALLDGVLLFIERRGTST